MILQILRIPLLPYSMGVSAMNDEVRYHKWPQRDRSAHSTENTTANIVHNTLAYRFVFFTVIPPNPANGVLKCLEDLCLITTEGCLVDTVPAENPVYSKTPGFLRYPVYRYLVGDQSNRLCSPGAVSYADRSLCESMCNVIHNGKSAFRSRVSF